MVDSLHTLRYYVDRGRHAYRNRAIGCYVAAAAVVSIVALMTGAEFYRQGPMVLVGILVLAGAGFHLWYRSLSWQRHGVLVALQTAPLQILRANVLGAQGKAALLDERQVDIATADASIMLTVKCSDLPSLAAALREHCPDAEVHGFEP